VFGGFVFPSTGAGWEPVDNAWEYDPAADTWKALPPMPGKRGAAIAFEVGGKFYVIGGAATHPGSKEVAIQGNGPGRSVDTNDMFDPATGRWQPRQEMPTARNHAFGGVVNGKIYVIGGRTGHGFITAATNTDLVEEYDPAIDSWGTLKTRMPTARSGGGWGTYGGRIFAAGGEVATAELVGAFRAVEAYNPATNAWDRLPSMPMPRHGVAGAMIGNQFHLVSGMVTSAAVGAGQDAHVEVHTASHDVIEVAPGGGASSAAR
jgi:N-acetylneuraminic acid mutarotase